MLKWEGIRMKQEINFRGYFLPLILINFIHPNFYMRNLRINLFNKFPFENLEIKINFILIALQNTIIMIDILRRSIIPLNYFDEKQKYQVRKKFMGNQTFPFFFKYMLKFRPFHLLFTILLFMEILMAMLLKIFESRVSF